MLAREEATRAVSLGIALALAFSVKRGLLPARQAERVEHHLATVGLPTRLAQLAGGPPDADRLMDLIAQDKKVRQGKLAFILARDIGESFIAPDVAADEVRAFLDAKLACS